MAWTRNNPNGLADGMTVRRVSQPSAVFRVSGDPDTDRATYVAMTKGQRTVLRGNARNYRPETSGEAAERLGEGTPEVEEVARVLRAVDPLPDDEEQGEEPDGVAALCARMEEVVALVADGTCSPEDAAAIVHAAAELNWAVTMTRSDTRDD